MSLRKEQVVFAATVALLALLAWATFGEGAQALRTRPARPPALERHPAPDTALALPQPRQAAADAAFQRDLFAPPRDTVPLPPLAVEPPPLPELTALAPPSWPGLAPRHYGRFLRAAPTPTPAPGLFTSEDAEDAQDGEPAEDGAQGGAGASLLGDLRAAAGRDEGPLTPAERQARLESWRRLYDWVVVGQGEPLFGHIRNQDRFGLAQRPGEPIRFQEVNPTTGQERFPGMPPVALERERVTGFGFADTPSNFLQVRKREFQPPISPSRYTALLAFAERALELRLEAREALEVAERMYRLAHEAQPDDPQPRMGLARVQEAAFDLEGAYATHRQLVADFPHRPEVHVGLAELEARLRLFESAQARLREAERAGGRTSWRVQWALGRFLFERERYAEALEALQSAFRYEPADPERKDVRAAIRSDLGWCQLALGEVREAADTFEKALQAEPRLGEALAGRIAARRLLGSQANGGDGGDAETAGEAPFRLQLARALRELDQRRFESARDQLELAAEADPLRAFAAWRALSWLAEISAHPAEAWRQIERAHENDPQDPWTLYQRGRLQVQRDDLTGARESFLAALDQDLDFVDALVALGELALRTDQAQAAERYFERALGLEPRPEVHALRGLNQLALGDARGAEASFRAALERDPDQPVARAGLAWVSYRRGDVQKAITQLAELDDARRARPEDDAYRSYARAQIARIQEHETRVVFTDRFERRKLLNDWDTEEAVGPVVELREGALAIAGTFDSAGTTRVHRRYAAPDFVSLAMDVTVAPENNARVGVFVSKERRRGAGQTEVQGMVSAARRKDGGLAVLTMDRATAEPQWEDVQPVGGPWWPAGRSVRVTIERVGEGSEAVGRISIDGVPVREGFPLRAMSTSTNELLVGVFVEGQTGLPAHVEVDDVQVVYKVRR